VLHILQLTKSIYLIRYPYPQIILRLAINPVLLQHFYDFGNCVSLLILAQVSNMSNSI